MTFEREIIKRGRRTFYVLRYPGGAVTYERSFDGFANLNVHQRMPAEGDPCWNCENGVDADGDPCYVCDGTGRRTGYPCDFLGGEPCDMDGTGLAPVLTDEADIWRLLASWIPRETQP